MVFAPFLIRLVAQICACEKLYSSVNSQKSLHTYTNVFNMLFMSKILSVGYQRNFMLSLH